jgi:hypothetical protein
MNILDTIVAKSDQINAADLVGGAMTVTVKDVKIAAIDQPVSFFLEETDKVYRPCKGMRRLIVQLWGPDAKDYIGRSLTLYCDPDVTWAGKKEGGIRISAMSHISDDFQVAIRTSKAATKIYQVRPLSAVIKADRAADWADAQVAAFAAAATLAGIDAVAAKGEKALAKLANERPELHAQVTAAEDQARSNLQEPDAFGLLPASENDLSTTDKPTLGTDFLKRLHQCELKADFVKLEDEFNTVADKLADIEYEALKPLIDAGRENFFGVSDA